MTGTRSCRTARLGLRVVLNLTHDPEDARIRADTSSARPGHSTGTLSGSLLETGRESHLICGSTGQESDERPATVLVCVRPGVLVGGGWPGSRFSRRYEQISQPFEWKFTRKDLHKVLNRLDQREPELQLAA